MSTAKKKNGHDTLTVEMVEILGRIATGIDGLRHEVAGLHKEVAATNERLDAFREETHQDFAALRADMTVLRNEGKGIRVETRADLDDIKERLAKVEAVVFKATG